MRLSVPLRDLVRERLPNVPGDGDSKVRSWRKNWGVVRTKLEECFGEIVILRRIAHGSCVSSSCDYRHFSFYNSLFKPGQL